MTTDTQQMPVHVDAPAGAHADTGTEMSRLGGGRTHPGCKRSENQDRMHVGERVFAVADGVGRYRGGGLAAEIALGPVMALDRGAGEGADIGMALRDAVHTANAEVRSRRQAEVSVRRMGTTLTVMVLDGPTAHIGHVGDSRLYRLRDGVLEQLTTDHTYVAELVEAGQLHPAAASDHPKSNVITRAVGTRAQIDVDVTQTGVQAGDVFLLCSDGLPSAVDEATIAQILTGRVTPSEAADRLVNEAVRAGVHDNVTAVVVGIAEPALS